MTPPPTAADLELSVEAERIVQLASQDLALRLGLALESIRLVSIEAVQWLDASLGCPQPGEVYAQVITRGLWLVLQADGRYYEYHTDTDHMLVVCGARTTAQGAPKGPQGTVKDGGPSQPRDTGEVERRPITLVPPGRQ